MLGELDQDQIDHLLRSEVIGRLGCHSDGRTYVVPVTYVYDGQCIYGHTGEGMKLRMMRANPHVCLEVDRIQNMANWQSAVVWGTFEELEGEEAVRAMELLLRRLTPLLTSETTIPFQGLEGAVKRHPGAGDGHAVVYRIHILEKTGRFEKR